MESVFSEKYCYIKNQKNKHKQKPITHRVAGDAKKPDQTASTKMALIFGEANFAAGALASQLNIVWTLGAAIFGTIGRFFIGQGIDKAASKK